MSWKAPSDTIETNVIGTVNLFEAVRKLGTGTKIQFAGSSEEYGMVLPYECPIMEDNALKPLSTYGVSKVAGDKLSYQYVKSYGMKIVITRAFNHTGPRRGENFVTSNFAKQIAEIENGAESIIRVGNLNAMRDFTDVRDMVRAYLLAIQKCQYGVPYNICSGQSVSIRSVLAMLMSMSKSRITIEEDASRLRPSDVELLQGDCTQFKRATGWERSYILEETLEDLLNYWRERCKR
jgi:GDP-4-dehydro-6-deoxy-D-mannose reductase